MARVIKRKTQPDPRTPLGHLMEEHLEWLLVSNYYRKTPPITRAGPSATSCAGPSSAASSTDGSTRPILESYQRYCRLRQKTAAAHVPHAALAANADLPVVSLTGAAQSHPVQPGLRSGPAAHGKAHPAHDLLGGGDRARAAGAGYPDAGGTAGPRDARNVLLDGHPAQRTGAPELYDVDRERATLTIREGKGKKDRMIPIGERALGVGGEISARGAPVAGRRAG